MSRHIKSILSAILSLVLLTGLFPAPAFAVTQEEINQVRIKRDAIRSQRVEKQALVDSLRQRQAGVLEQKSAMDERSDLTLEQIALTQEEIRLNDQLLEQKELELAEARELEENQLRRYRVRVRTMEEEGRLGFLSIVLRSTSLAEALSLFDQIGEIMQSDRALEDAYIKARRHTETVKAELEVVRNELLERHRQLEEEQEQLQLEIAEAENLIQTLRQDIEVRQNELESIQSAEWAVDAELQQLMAELERQRREEEERRRQKEERQRREEEARRQAAEEAKRQREEAERKQQETPEQPSDTVLGTGSFLWPVPGYTYITSRFGLRIHPITGVKKSHTGMDISADTGTAIVAADSGTVTKAAVYGGYGNCIILNHGNGYASLYGHMSRFAVQEGDHVTQGQTIGYVGSTGLSTGPHCHFEVWSGGSRVDPEQFFSGLEFAPGAGE